MHYYQWNIGDYASHTAHLDELEDLAYRRMIDYCYLNEIGLPESVDEVARLIRMRTHTECIANVLREFFDLHSDGVYRHPRVEREIESFREKSGKAAKAAHKRWEKERANALRAQCEGNANQEPETNNQEPETSKQITSPAGSGEAVPYQAIVDLYHEALPELSSVRLMNNKRKAAIRQRHNGPMGKDLDTWRKYFDSVRGSDFLMGRIDGKVWRADFDFLITEKAITGVVEGKYHAQHRQPDRSSGHQSERRLTPAERVRAARARSAGGSSCLDVVGEDGGDIRSQVEQSVRRLP